MATLAIQDDPARLVGQEIQDPQAIQARKAHQDHQAHQVVTAQGATVDDQPSQHQTFPESQASQANRAPTEHQESQVHQAATDFQATLDPQAHQDLLANLARTAMQALKDQLDHQAPQVKRVFVRNTAPWMVASSSKTALVVSQSATATILPINCPTTDYTYILPFLFVIITYNSSKPRAHASSLVLR
jgi:hypothetical protein